MAVAWVVGADRPGPRRLARPRSTLSAGSARIGAQQAGSRPSREPRFGCSGANLPWLQYGCDFGANPWQPDGGVGRPEQRERLRRSFARLADRGLTTVRWFVLVRRPGGRAVRRARGSPAAWTTLFWRDLEAGLDEAARVGHRRSCRCCSTSAGAAGRGAWTACGAADTGRAFASPARPRRSSTAWSCRCSGAALRSANCRVGHHQRARVGDVGRRVVRPVRTDSAARDAAIHRPGGVRVHAETRQPATVGLASTRGLGLVDGLGLDIYQVHWYDKRERRSPLGRPVPAQARLPLWLGEFPTAGSRRSPEELSCCRAPGRLRGRVRVVGGGR